MTGSIRPFYADWAGYNRRIVEGLAGCSPETLALQAPRSDHWPIWAIAGHMAGTRVYWLCGVFGEPGAEGTPFGDDARIGWEDDLTRPRSGAELEHALTSTWRIVDSCLRRWTPETLGEAVRRDEAGRPPEFHTRQSLLLRMISHDAYHLGEINVALSSNGREPIDPWPGHEWAQGASVHLREG